MEKPLKYRQSSLKAFDYTTPYPVKDSLLSAVGYTEETYLGSPEKAGVTVANAKAANQAAC